jgi:ATP-dependent helicase/nuclease subunit A
MSIDPKSQTLSKAADTGKSVHLSASAGSGKTRALKDRYLALLDALEQRGLNIDQAVAITFTDKAAAEIKERVMRDLPEAMLKKIIRGRQDLRISTIHSFCMNLLKRYPLEAGLPPDFGVLDDRDKAYKVQKAVEDALEESDRDPGIMAPLAGLSADGLMETIGSLFPLRSKLKRMEIDAGGPENLVRLLGSGMEIDKAEQSLAEQVASPEGKTLFTQMELLLRSQGDYYEECWGPEHGLLASARDARAACRAAEALMPVYFTQKGEPRKKAAIAKSRYCVNKTFPCAVYETLFSRVQDVLAQFMSDCRRARSGYEAISLLRLFQRAEAKYQDSKLREGLLDFDDLEVYAYRLLQGQESSDILYWLDRKILHFLVDEFQDTSDIQWAILNKLTEEIFAGIGADKPMRPTLFVVGDEKQSIYRFREANYRLILNVKQKMERNLPPGSREVLTLDRNFRSTPEVVDTVNKVFGALWGKAYQPSGAEREAHKGSVRLIELLPGTKEGTALGPTEAEILSREIDSFIGSGTIIYERTSNANPPQSPFSQGGSENIPPLTKGGGGGFANVPGWIERKANYGDCAILIQSRTKLKEYEAALQAAGVPFRVVGGIGFYEEDEIQAVINVLFFLWNHDDKLALAAALKSPLFGLIDKDIFDLVRDSGNMVEAMKDRRPDDWKLLHAWMNLAGLVPLSGLIHRIVKDTGAYVRFGRRNPQAIFNIDKLLDTAREFDRRGYTTLQDFVEWVGNIRAAEQREATADMNLPGFQGAVSIMTVHKAKGLEYPVVFLPAMNQAPRSVTHGPGVIIDERDTGIRMALKDGASPLYEEMWEREKEELRREHQRLLYVAMTRARDHLVMIGTLNRDERPLGPHTWLGYLHEAAPKPLFDSPCEPMPGVRRYSCPSAPGEAVTGSKPPRTPLAGHPARKDGFGGPERLPLGQIDVQGVIKNLSPVPPSRSAEWKRATDFIEQDAETALELFSRQASVETVSPLTRGLVLHRCLDEHTRPGSYSLERIIADFPDILSLEEEARHRFLDDARSVLNRVLMNNELAWIFERSVHSYSELPFLYKRGNTLVSGVIDRVVIRDDRAHVVDYKAILLENDKALKAWSDHYRPQVLIYCEAVKELFRLRSVEGSLLFLDSNRLETIVRL